MSLRVAYRRDLGLIACGLFKIPSKAAVWFYRRCGENTILGSGGRASVMQQANASEVLLQPTDCLR